ncbi:hypothetical protein [Bdellovibrio sp. ArHS]|uniref:hypothetical protein n=1 Tax=Bdellovibrio sp. ArHS TaxID=1569284 RepID=UPI0025B82BF3|nr:hypothetical protein [Bdellovibrio sp. ArHS]
MNSLQKDQILHAIVEEVTSAKETLCNFQGELLLVGNHTGLPLKKGDPIKLQIISTHPLQFQIFDAKNMRFQRVV